MIKNILLFIIAIALIVIAASVGDINRKYRPYTKPPEYVPMTGD